jgi:hypothetical protein
MAMDLEAAEQAIAKRIDTDVSHAMVVSDRAGGVAFSNVGEVTEFAKYMGISGVAVPKHLRGNIGACLAVCIQAIEWRMSPFAVANKSYSVNDRLAYEAQLIAAVVMMRAPIAKGEFPDYSYEGEGPNLVCTVRLKMRGGKILEYTSPRVADIKVKNSPLWTGDPQQQLGYYSIRAWARRHVPHVILGVYARDELPDDDDHDARSRRAKDVTPEPAAAAKTGLAAKMEALHKPAAAEPARERLDEVDEVIDPDTGEITTAGEATDIDEVGDLSSSGAPANDDEPEDEEVSELLQIARDKALKGSRALRLWRGSLTTEQIDELRPFERELQTRAAMTDADKATKEK